MKVFYSHHLYKYDTEVEDYELDLIHSKFPNATIINPNGSVDQSKTECEIMQQCLDFVRDSDAVIFSSLSGIIGKGVFDELTLAITLNKPIYYVQYDNVTQVEPTFTIIYNRTESRRRYAIVEIKTIDK